MTASINEELFLVDVEIRFENDGWIKIEGTDMSAAEPTRMLETVNKGGYVAIHHRGRRNYLLNSAKILSIITYPHEQESISE